MKIITVVVGPIRTNCYIVASEKGKEAIVIDPGDEGNKIIDAIEASGLKPVLIVNTHAHPDHVGANLELAKRYKISAAVSESDYNLVKGWGSYFEEFAEMKIADFMFDRLLRDGDPVTAEGLELKVIATPGHSKGSICLYGDGVLFSGDTLFWGDTGRADIPGGSEEEMEKSISILMRLPESTKVYPGHGRPTTIAGEKELHAKH